MVFALFAPLSHTKLVAKALGGDLACLSFSLCCDLVIKLFSY